jgi:hypothetical protein
LQIRTFIEKLNLLLNEQEDFYMTGGSATPLILNAQQIQSVLDSLKVAYNEQVRILNDSERIICQELGNVWECQAQVAYRDVFIGIKNNILTQINSLILFFGTALEQSQNGLYQVQLDLKNMNTNAFTG